MDSLGIFCRQVRARSAEHRLAVARLGSARTHGTIVGILRQELDSMVRVVYLLSVTDRGRREEWWQRAPQAGSGRDRTAAVASLIERWSSWLTG